ncbi:FHA domain-containing protein [Fuerstiella marisgermanici]|uniref:Type VI secretion system FHA domain protein n=1 Tax=Fuerstiella marisgermanici TaxID=1891926 RepID=A0A1P8WNE0_9PLAN|nr:FHA domain-containing protein [Fuerstiella marisgermanici]APZ95551.1 type VI secretion system FHA domain protein [Fuerstiella marisgermanici]
MKHTLNEDENPIQQTVSEPLQQLLKLQANNGADVQGIDNLSRPADQPMRFRPSRRPPTALLTILDDGSDTEGQLTRIRTTKFTLGRVGCDVNIPFDPDLSSVHATLECVHKRGEYRWFLVDQASTNGTFLRAYKARPKHGAELMIGSRRYEFRTSTSAHNPVKADPEQTITYIKSSSDEALLAIPRLVEVTGTDCPGRSFTLDQDIVEIGQDAGCDVRIENDPYVSPLHAKLTKEPQQRWLLEDQKSVNGVWIRINRIALAHQAEFQLGQQRFVFEVR